ncbi:MULTISPECIES: DUF3604 domain-containing protein [unclassified Ruegeria]|uniref:DUF3604 domain-containing protein n=1 Tax=unclassified Ruegeria TaxID=2625375 RepID=UPI001ADCDBC5|nr:MULTISPECIES: DUF3604 domain-containing protein [unclassified Ruegeria]MBO9410969.1 DUF3604 domain-containing protein [Ruegeria sp. R8_1]MBO9415170.1 DUF3604 domain-containing protein [Ruegeria sp. R8_2]
MRSLLIIALGSVCGTTAFAQDTPPVGPAEMYSPYPEQNFPNQVFFGDTHLHTTYSADAGLFGNTLGPDEAYRFAKGETVTSSTGLPARLARPLDFLVVADHAENMGTAPLLEARDPRLLETEYGSSLLEALDADDLPRAWEIFSVTKASGEDPLADVPGIYESVWQEMTAAAERHNQPGGFTAFIGFEWSSTFDRSNLHRNVIYRGGKENADTRLPFSQYDSANPEDLWDWMEAYEADTGDKLLAIPHNGNLSNGLMFDSVKLGSDEPLDTAYAERRARWEPLYEVTQMKGDGEAHPMLSPDDAFADFETWDKGQLGPNPKTPEMIPNEYAREALKRGLAYRTELGVNPFKFGLIGSTDSHTSLATSRENNHFGKVVALEPTADPIRFEEVVGGVGGDDSVAQYAWQTSASGLAAVWARENTREAIFDAMMRKEVYATTGTRLSVRVFAGYDFEESDLPRSDFAAHGYANGVPMGGDLGKSEGRAPRFLIRALRDPDGANLDRVQVIKGWLNADGSTSEKVYDISCGGREVIDAACDGVVGNTVNAQEATYTNDIGQAILAGYWEDPDFDPSQSAFYYVRVLEIPTPRWTTYDRKFFGVELPEGAPESIQDRAYTSPIWYTP